MKTNQGGVILVLNATHGVGGGVVTVGHFPMEVSDKSRGWDPFKIKVMKWRSTWRRPTLS